MSARKKCFEDILEKKIKLKLIQMPTNKKQWHIVSNITDRCIQPKCGCMGYYIGGYHKDKPEQTLKNAKMMEVNDISDRNMCPSCVKAGYVSGILKVNISNDNK